MREARETASSHPPGQEKQRRHSRIELRLVFANGKGDVATNEQK
jgi:hypothetical protein